MLRFEADLYNREFPDLIKAAEKFQEKLSKVKVFVSDVDGIMTTGDIIYSSKEVGFNRAFNAHDGYGFRILKNFGIKTALITGGNSLGVKLRAEYLNVDYLFMGSEDKREALDKIIESEKCQADELIYLGDELFDIPLLKKVGFSATVSESPVEVKRIVDYITYANAGRGACREVIDMLLYAKDLKVEIPDY